MGFSGWPFSNGLGFSSKGVRSEGEEGGNEEAFSSCLGFSEDGLRDDGA
jgi:hypothetical protein